MGLVKTLIGAPALVGGAYLLYKGGKEKNWGLALIAVHAIGMYFPQIIPDFA